MTCQRRPSRRAQQTWRASILLALLFMYDACALGYLSNSPLSVSNRRSRVNQPGTAPRAPDRARVEPESEGRSIQTRQEQEERIPLKKEKKQKNMGEVS